MWTRQARVRKASRTLLTSSRLIAETVGPLVPVMVTLTYRPGVEWEPRHVSGFLKCVREWARRCQCGVFAYVWCAELQRRGAVHYHCLMWFPDNVTLPKPDTRGWWPHGFTSIERARNAVGYVAKYASKVATKMGDFPRGLRLQGSGGLGERARCQRRWCMAAKWVRDKVLGRDEPKGWQHWPGVDLRKVSLGNGQGGYLCRDTGELYVCPWKLTGFGMLEGERYFKLTLVGG